MGSSRTLSIASVNVNGIRAAKRNGMDPWIAERAADIVTMQEVRAPDDIFVDHVDTMFGEDWHRVHAESEALLATLTAVEAACQRAFSEKGKEIWANVDFYKGAVFHSLGIPSQYFTAMFAMARVYGYIAHYLEFSRESRLIRPRALYRQSAA